MPAQKWWKFSKEALDGKRRMMMLKRRGKRKMKRRSMKRRQRSWRKRKRRRMGTDSQIDSPAL